MCSPVSDAMFGIRNTCGRSAFYGVSRLISSQVQAHFLPSGTRSGQVHVDNLCLPERVIIVIVIVKEKERERKRKRKKEKERKREREKLLVEPL